jgi:hypothetical protein
VLEHGTANAPDAVFELLRTLTHGAITVNRGGIDRRASIPGWYDGPAKGNPRFKALVEAHHTLDHNARAHLVGQIGRGRDFRPEEYSGRSAFNKALLQAVAALPPSLVEMIRWPFPLFSQYEMGWRQISDIVEDRKDHDIEGFVAAGLVKWEFKTAPGLAPTPGEVYDALSPEEKAALDVIIRKPGMITNRVMSPREAFERGRGKLRKIPHYAVPLILRAGGEDISRPVTVSNNHQIIFDDREFSTDKIVFLAELITPSGRVVNLTPGQEFSAHINPFDTSFIYLSEIGKKDGAFIGLCKRWEIVSQADQEAIGRAKTESAKQVMKLLRPVARRGAAITRARREDDEHHLKILETAHAAHDFTKTVKSEKDLHDEIDLIEELNPS